MNIKNLVFEGGGVKGIAYAGAIEVLQMNNILQQVERVAGTSAGAITASLLSIGCDSKFIFDAAMEDFSKFEDSWDPLRIATKYGLYKGDAFLEWLKEKFAKQSIPADITFSNLRELSMQKTEKHFRELKVFATDLNSKDVKEFSFEKTPHVCVLEAVRASMSIPLFFAAWKFSDNNPDDHIYVDGGVVYNYPITAFDHGKIPNEETLGFHLDNMTGQSVNNLDYNELKHYIVNLVDMIMDGQVIDFHNDPSQVKRSVSIDDLGFSATNFKLSVNDKMKLYESGKKYTDIFLSGKR